jgi:streptomycin 3"-adenylyltransferase
LGREAPRSVSEQVDRLVEGLRDVLGARLRGVYVHGSLALGCFNSARSDVDLLVAVDRSLDTDTKLLLADLLLRVSCAPHAVELHVLSNAQLEQWTHPSPFEFHYGESHREAYALEPIHCLEAMPETDADLAAHVTIARHAGIAVLGPPSEAMFPVVPFDDYRCALGTDLEWARTVRSALYGILSPCRVWATLATGEVQSKASGARWALERLPHDLTTLVETALASYTGAGEPIEVDETQRQRLLDYIEAQIRQ